MSKLIKLEVPLVLQEKKNDCGIAALQMAFSYFQKNVSRSKIEELVMADKSGIIWSLGLARAAANLGFQVEFYSKYLELHEELYNLDFFKKNADKLKETKKKLIYLKSECEKEGVKLHSRTLDLNELISKFSSETIPILILDWGLVEKGMPHTMHFVPIVGFDKENMYVNEPGRNKKQFYKIEKSIFDEARKANGTDEDIIFISKK